MKKRLMQFYESFGDRGVMFILYTLCVVVNVLPAVFAELPSVFPDEINVAGLAAFYSGRDWSGLLSRIAGGSGYVQALLYAPLFWIIRNPYALYKAMLIINAFLVGFIPLIVYSMSKKLGVERVRRKLLIALGCGMYASYITSSKFVWNEPITCLCGWLPIFCAYGAWEKSRSGQRGSHSLYSVLGGILCALAYASNKRLISVVAALAVTVVLARVLFKEKIFNLPLFGISLAVSFAADFILRSVIEQALWGTHNGVAHEISEIGADINSAGRLFGVLFSQIYAFMTSSVGMGSLAAALFVLMMLSYISESIKSKSEKSANNNSPENSKAPVQHKCDHKYDVRPVVFACFQFLAVGFTALTSAFFSLGTGSYPQEAAVFGRYTDNLAPFAVFLVLVYVFLYGIDLIKLFIGAGIYGYACICFAAAGYPLAKLSDSFIYSPLFGMFPALFGEDKANAGMKCIMLSSLVFSVYALAIVFVSCTRRHRTALFSGSVFCVLMAAAVASFTVYLPAAFKSDAEKMSPYKEVGSLLHNDPQSPPIVLIDDAKAAAVIQFLTPDVHVNLISTGEAIPESCLLVAKTSAGTPFTGGTYDVVGRTEEYAVYACGETARDFMRFYNAADKGTNSNSR